VVTKLKYILSKNDDIWKNCIGKNNKVIVDGEFIKLEKHLKVSNDFLNSIRVDDPNYINNSYTKKLFVVSNTLYTFLKCKYSILVAKLLRFINKSIKSCQHIKDPPIDTDDITMNNCIELTLDNFIIMKPYLSKAIFGLFYFNNLSENLKLSDQTLLISLLTINKLLCNKDNVVYEIQNYKRLSSEYDNLDEQHIFIDADQHFIKLVNQLIYSLENFLCINCYYTFTLLDYNNGDSIIYNDIKSGSKFTVIKEKIKDFINMSYVRDFIYLNSLKFDNAMNPDDLEKFSYSNIYDSQYVLLKEVFGNENDFRFPPMEFGLEKGKNIAKIIKDVETSYDIRKVLKYQIYLIEFIGSIFFVQIQHIITFSSQYSYKKEAFGKLETLIKCFVDYVDNIIPKNYPPILLRFINELKNALLTDLNQSESNGVLLSQKSQKLLMRNSKIWTENPYTDLYLNISMPNLIKKILGLHYNESFKQIFEILLQESNTPDHFYSIQAEDHKEMEVSLGTSKIDTEVVCLHLGKTREYLLLLWSYLDKIEDRNNRKNQMAGLMKTKLQTATDNYLLLQDDLIPSFDNIFLYMAHVYNKTNDFRLRMILLPVLVHFKRTEWILYKDKDKISKKITLIQRTLIMAVNSLQYYEVNKCNVAELNQSIVNKLSTYIKQNMNSTYNIHLQLIFKTKIYKYDNYKNHTYINGVIDTTTFSDILEIINGTYLTNIKFFWSGLEMNILELSRDITQNIVSYQRLLKYETLIIHFLLVKIYTQLEYLFKFPIRLTKYRIIAIRKYLEEFSRLEYSVPLVLGLQDIFQSYLNIFENEDISEKNIKLFQNQINDQIKDYGIFELDDTQKCMSFNDCYASLKNDIETFKKYLINLKRNKQLSYKNDFAVPMIWKEISLSKSYLN